jgi:predicted RNase H-like HicB family nuclease
MEFLVVLEKDDETGDIVADVPQIPGCHTSGRTKDEAMRNIREAIELCLEDPGVVPGRLFGVERIEVPG